ncbi:MAG: pyridoxal-phosphate dependent enzyme, partial [Nanoarchaeota archaeon]
MNKVVLRCIDCKTKYSNWNILQCSCGSILEVVHDFKQLKEKLSIKKFDERLALIDPPYNSGVWRYKEMVLDIKDEFIISMPEGNTNLYNSNTVSEYAEVKNLYLKAEGQNPTCSFKDRGMTTAISVAKMLGYKRVACAS